VGGIAGDHDPAGLVALGHEGVAGHPGDIPDDVDGNAGADRALHPADDFVRIDIGPAVARLDQHHELVGAVERDDHAARAGIRVDGPVHPGPAVADEFRIEVRDAHVDGEELPGPEGVLGLDVALVVDPERLPDEAAPTVARHGIGSHPDRVLRSVGHRPLSAHGHALVQARLGKAKDLMRAEPREVGLIERVIAGQAETPHVVGNAELAVDLHRAGVLPVALGMPARRRLGVEERRPHPVDIEREREHQSDRPPANDRDLGRDIPGVRHAQPFPEWSCALLREPDFSTRAAYE
jgi:hypothetical protein